MGFGFPPPSCCSVQGEDDKGMPEPFRAPCLLMSLQFLKVLCLGSFAFRNGKLSLHSVVLSRLFCAWIWERKVGLFLRLMLIRSSEQSHWAICSKCYLYPSFLCSHQLVLENQHASILRMKWFGNTDECFVDLFSFKKRRDSNQVQNVGLPQENTISLYLSCIFIFESEMVPSPSCTTSAFQKWKVAHLTTLHDITHQGVIKSKAQLDRTSYIKLPWYECLQLKHICETPDIKKKKFAQITYNFWKASTKPTVKF